MATINWPDFSLMAREDAIAWFLKQNDPKLERLIQWVAESSVMEGSYQEIRIAIAEAGRRAVLKEKGEELHSSLPPDSIKLGAK